MGKELPEFQVAVAEDAGVRGPAPAVLGDEVCNDYLLHFL